MTTKRKAVTAVTMPAPSIDSIILLARRSVPASKVTAKTKGGYATLWGSNLAKTVAKHNPGRRFTPSITVNAVNEQNVFLELFPNFEWLGAIVVSVDPLVRKYRLEGVALLPDGTVTFPRNPATQSELVWKDLPKSFKVSKEHSGQFDALSATLKSAAIFADVRSTAEHIIRNTPEIPGWLIELMTASSDGGALSPDELFTQKVPYTVAVMKQSVSKEGSKKVGRLALFTPARFNHLFCRGAYKNAVISTAYLRKGPATPVETVRLVESNPVVRL